MPNEESLAVNKSDIFPKFMEQLKGFLSEESIKKIENSPPRDLKECIAEIEAFRYKLRAQGAKRRKA